MPARALRLPGTVCRRDISAPQIVDPDHLRRLTRRIAAEDRTAFAELYRVLSPTLTAVARSRALDLVDATAVISATFNEVWWMARFHTGADADICAWTMDIVMRRATDRSPSVAGSRPGLGSGAWTTTHDQHLDSTLSALLGLPSGNTSGPPPSPKR